MDAYGIGPDQVVVKISRADCIHRLIHMRQVNLIDTVIDIKPIQFEFTGPMCKGSEGY